MRKRTLKSVIFAIVAVMAIGLTLVGCGEPAEGGGETGGESGGNGGSTSAPVTTVTEAEYEAACGEVLLNNDYVYKMNGKDFFIASGNFVLGNTYLTYYEKSGDEYYVYERKNGKYTKTESTAETYESTRKAAAGYYVGKYSQFTYDETQKAYVAETIAIDEELALNNVKIKFEDKKLVSAIGYFGEEEHNRTIEYVSRNLSAPFIYDESSVVYGPVTKEQWVAALTDKLLTENYRFDSYIRSRGANVSTDWFIARDNYLETSGGTVFVKEGDSYYSVSMGEKSDAAKEQFEDRKLSPVAEYVNSYDSFEAVGNYYHAVIDGANIIIHFDNAGRIVSFDYSKSDYSKTLKWQYGDFVVKPV